MLGLDPLVNCQACEFQSQSSSHLALPVKMCQMCMHAVILHNITNKFVPEGGGKFI
ncbi:hypothetical protein RchiOBHm_Chr5g0052591 [Rosa chinensis]|uniref:Uncharacterized protein n=1 Tax=Rosa chinensis TaxID=74649 RepID=A0A2P6QFQ3_ROSCH|nr:hypothetical protein RchiOBHm_Chr5g0052591 [Rosa chinensis]